MRAAYTRGICMLDAPSYYKYVQVMYIVQRVRFVSKVQNSRRELCLYGSTGNVTLGHCSTA